MTCPILHNPLSNLKFKMGGIKNDVSNPPQPLSNLKFKMGGIRNDVSDPPQPLFNLKFKMGGICTCTLLEMYNPLEYG